MMSGSLICTVALANQKTLKRFRDVINEANSLIEDLPWRDEPAKIIEGLQFILDSIECKVTGK